MSATSSTDLRKPSTVSETTALHQFRLLEAVQSGDRAKLEPFLSELELPSSDQGASLLNRAVKVAGHDTIAHILSHPRVDPNVPYPEPSGTTPIHLASSEGRADVVELLLAHPRIDDTKLDASGQSCLDIAATDLVVDTILKSRNLYQSSFLGTLSTYISSPNNAPLANEKSTEKTPAQEIYRILRSSRSAVLDLNAIDQSSGTTLLHEAVRRKDLNIIRLLALERGADVFVRDRNGNRVFDGQKSVGANDAVSNLLKQASNNQKSQLESPSDGKPITQRGYLAKYVNIRHGYKQRWFVLENGMLSYYRSQEEENKACRGSVALSTYTVKPTSSSAFELHSPKSNIPTFWLRSSSAQESAKWTQAIKLHIEFSRTGGGLEPSSNSTLARSSGSIHRSAPARTNSFSDSNRFSRTPSFGASSSPKPNQISVSRQSIDMSVDEDALDDDEDDESYGRLRKPYQLAGLPHESSFKLVENSIALRIEQLQGMSTADPVFGQTLEALKAAQESYKGMVSDRERWLISRYQHEIDGKLLWERAMQDVAQQQQTLERDLEEASRVNQKHRKELKAARLLTPIAEPPAIEQQDGFPIPASAISQPLVVPATTTTTSSLPSDADPSQPNVTIALPDPPTFAVNTAEDSDDEDEFFDAIESGALPLVVSNSMALAESRRQSVSAQMKAIKDALPAGIEFESKDYEPYTRLRSRLPISSDERPSVSLWSVLKSSIGKDLTKISFPVAFNECTSFLQRMAEDMEYAECLDAAATEPDALKRIAYVAAFAMSNYSSTYGRIAKPFNPMLGETFEYARPDKGFRYVSEQVSHHPPISACWSDSPKFHYYGEVDAKNVFRGKSFEIRPTGIAHADLKIPASWVKDPSAYPTDPSSGDLLIEHYSWKKVTTNVSNFIMGSPIIDHYGDLEVTNHRTGETCILTFKPRGWKASNSCEIKGVVKTPSGQDVWELAGRWTSQLVARKAGAGHGDLQPDDKVNASAKEYLLLWKNGPKPAAPFNLTPFAITLNDIPQGLEPLLPLTDCRRRPDQRAFESAKYDEAQTYKEKQEDFQRATRKRRENGELPPHSPRWFTRTIEKDTGVQVWEPKRTPVGQIEYWSERTRAAKEGSLWTDVPEIFIKA